MGSENAILIGGMVFAAASFSCQSHIHSMCILTPSSPGLFDIGPMSSELVTLPPRKHSLRPRYLEGCGLGET